MTGNLNQMSRKNGHYIFGACVLAAAPLLYRFAQPYLQQHQREVVAWHCEIASLTTPVGSPIDGRLVHVPVVPGQQVRRGETIARLDSSILEIQKRQYQTQLTGARNQLTLEKALIEQEQNAHAAETLVFQAKLALASGSVKWRSSRLEWLNREVKRSERLVKTGAMPRAAFEELLADRDSLRAQLQLEQLAESVARSELECHQASLTTITERQKRIESLQQSVENAELKIKEAMEMIARTEILAPFDGLVTRVLSGAGSSVRVGDSIAMIESSHRWCECWVDENQLAAIPIGANVKIQLAGIPDSELLGVVQSAMPGNQLDPAQPKVPLFATSAKLRLKVGLDNRHEIGLASGMTGSAWISKVASDKPRDGVSDY